MKVLRVCDRKKGAGVYVLIQAARRDLHQGLNNHKRHPGYNFHLTESLGSSNVSDMKMKGAAKDGPSEI